MFSFAVDIGKINNLDNSDGIISHFFMVDEDLGVMQKLFPDFKPKITPILGNVLDPERNLAHIIIRFPDKEDALMFKMLYNDMIDHNLTVDKQGNIR